MYYLYLFNTHDTSYTDTCIFFAKENWNREIIIQFLVQRLSSNVLPTRTGSQQFVAGYPKQLGALSYAIGQKYFPRLIPIEKRMRMPWSASLIGVPFFKGFFFETCGSFMEETQTSSKDRLKPIMTSFGFVLIEKNIEATKVLKVIPAWWFDSQTCLGKADPQPWTFVKSRNNDSFFFVFQICCWW